jgi:hypothetical protein
MKKRVHEQVWPTLAVAAAGFGLLAIALPEWARLEVLLFGAVYGVLVVLLDVDVRNVVVKSKRATPPASRRAAISTTRTSAGD